jgi:hypothetical protein
MTDEELRSATVRLRATASPVGPLHAYWDIIFDAEAILEGRRSMLSRIEIERRIRDAEANG